MRVVSMLSGSRRRIWIVVVLGLLFLVWPRAAAGFGRRQSEAEAQSSQVRARLAEGFRQILDYFARNDLSLLVAWREMRASGDPEFFERTYPGISDELDSWAATLEKQFGVDGSVARDLDFTFLLEEFAPVALDPGGISLVRDNAVATISMVCLMDSLRCEPTRLHRFLAAVVVSDPSALRKAEALRCLRRSGGVIDEGFLEQVLSTPAAFDLDLRSEAAKILAGIGTSSALQAQRRLVSTDGVTGGVDGDLQRVACGAIERLASARFEPAVPDLIRALDDPLPEVRACAAAGLAEISGQRPAFDAHEAGAANEAAKAAWRAWWRARTHSGGAGS